jgi:hypothetical protein
MALRKLVCVNGESEVRATVPLLFGKVIVLSAVGSVIARVVSNALSVAPSNIRLPFNSISFFTIKLMLANEVHYPLNIIVPHYAAPIGLKMDVEITFAVTLVKLVTAALNDIVVPEIVALRVGFSKVEAEAF